MPDVEGSLLEIRHVLDTLKADGISLFHQLRQPVGGGNMEFRPVLEEAEPARDRRVHASGHARLLR